MNKGSRNLLIGIVIGASAGFIAGVMFAGNKNKYLKGKEKKVEGLKSKISNLAADAQERINALKAMARHHQEKTDSAN